ncbi:MAG: SIMPL domain-containing protein, partial [Sandaracinobacteroides sp.]
MTTAKFLVALALAAAAQGAIAQQAMAQRAATTLTLSATAEVQAAPDIADIGAGVVTQASEAQAALGANSTQMARVMQALRKAGIADRDIQTSGLSLQPQYRYEQNAAPVLTGFQASNRVQVTLRDVKSAGRVIDTLVTEGANQI